MATIKSFTSLEQSKKLAEILPLESADMVLLHEEPYETSDSKFDGLHQALCVPFSKYDKSWRQKYKNISYFPCWSLAALLNLLPNEISTGERYCDKYQIDIRKHDGGDNTTLYQIAYGNNRGLSGSWHDMINTSEKESAIDACYEMILNLNELNLL